MRRRRTHSSKKSMGTDMSARFDLQAEVERHASATAAAQGSLGKANALAQVMGSFYNIAKDNAGDAFVAIQNHYQRAALAQNNASQKP